MENNVYTGTVSQINKYIKQMMDKNQVLSNIWVKGEISNYKQHYSGHCYLTLKDDGGVLKAVMFKGSAGKLSFTPENGMKILARGRVSVYERDGAYQLYIEEMQLDGVGSLHIAYEQLKAKLAEEGLFDDEHKKKLPKYPNTIGVITATTGAAVRDIINVLGRRYPHARVLIYPSLVQGEGAAAQIAGGIEYFNMTKSADVLIVGRGGGSIEDLWAFNEEITARAIFASNIPVISAVGHETDFTIADFVADMRAPTPSAAAELAVPSIIEIANQFDTQKKRMIYSVNNAITCRYNQVKNLQVKNPQGKIDDARIALDDISKRIIRNSMLLREKKRDTLSALAGKLQAMSPLAVLNRGYGIAKTDDGAVIRSVKAIEPELEFELIFSDGSARCKAL